MATLKWDHQTGEVEDTWLFGQEGDNAKGKGKEKPGRKGNSQGQDKDKDKGNYKPGRKGKSRDQAKGEQKTVNVRGKA